MLPDFRCVLQQRLSQEQSVASTQFFTKNPVSAHVWPLSLESDKWETKSGIRKEGSCFFLSVRMTKYECTYFLSKTFSQNSNQSFSYCLSNSITTCDVQCKLSGDIISLLCGLVWLFSHIISARSWFMMCHSWVAHWGSACKKTPLPLPFLNSDTWGVRN